MTSIEEWIKQARAVAAQSSKPDSDKASKNQPAVAIIMAADFPVDPSVLTGIDPGALYVIRTAAGLVPPAAGEGADLSVGAALEYAVRILKVDHIIQIAHAECGLVRGLTDVDAPGTATMMQGDFLPAWINLAAASISGALRSTDEDARVRRCGEELLRVGFENLMTYQWILDRVWAGDMGLHGWYFDGVGGTVSRFDPATDRFTGD